MATIPLQPFILGYSGCLVIEKNSKWHAWKGLLSITRNGEILYYNDPDRRIEKLVTGTAPSLVRAVIKSMEPGLI